jgi:4-hydroxy-tetrahydrodipicolinate synthase
MSDFSQFYGCYTALITPFKGEGVDVAAFEQFVEWQIEQGIHGLVPCGTTGESPTLTPAEKVGADAALVVAPYYNKPTQEGLYQHFKAVAAATSLPIFIYNIPGRSVVNLTDATLARLAEIKNIAGIKDATGDLARIATLRHLVGDRLVQFSGEDMTAVGFNAMGGRGVISVVSNIAPQLSAEVQNLSLAGKHDAARTLHATLVPLISAMFVETNPMPVKFASALMKKTDGSMRLPLVQPTEPTKSTVRDALADLKLI